MLAVEAAVELTDYLILLINLLLQCPFLVLEAAHGIGERLVQVDVALTDLTLSYSQPPSTSRRQA